MPISPLKLVIRRLRAATERDGAGKTDGELLTRFLSQRDNDALAALVHRHAPMVWGVCRRLLRSPHDAEDAFQATFLVLVRKAATVMPREMVGNWLYGVAHQTGVRLRAMAAKRGVREVQMKELPEPVVAETRGDDLLVLLDQELSRLPEKYRVLIVLCDLESKTRSAVARQLALPEGTVASRLARARGMLAKRLARHGLAVSGGSLAAALSQTVASASVPTSVVSSTIKVVTLVATGKTAAIGLVSAKVAALTEGVLKAMLMSKLKAVVAVVLVLGCIATGATILTCRTAAAQDKQPAAVKPVEPAAKQEKEKEGFTAWGKEVGSLQAGLGFRPGEKRAYSHGETVTLVVRVRNVGNENVKFRYLKEFFLEKPPTVTGGESKTIRLGGVNLFGRLAHIPVDVNLAPGKEMELHDLKLKLEPASQGGDVTEVSTEALHGKGKFQIQYEQLAAASIDPNLTKLATGKLELEVKEAEKPKENDPKAEKDDARPSLLDAIKALNTKASSDLVGKDETPLTEPEVIAVIRAAERPKDTAVTDKLFDAFKKIAETKQLPPGAELEAVGGIWDPGTSFVYDVWWVRVRMPKESGGTYGFAIRERLIRSRTLQEELARLETERPGKGEPAIVDGGRLQERINDLKARIEKLKSK